jgi:hypothetical protein
LYIKAVAPSAFKRIAAKNKMSPQIQTLLALLVVAIAATWLVVRSLAKKKHPGCGGDCGCSNNELKAKLKN